MKKLHKSTIFFILAFLIFIIISVYVYIFSNFNRHADTSSIVHVNEPFQYRYGISLNDNNRISAWASDTKEDTNWSEFKVPGAPPKPASNPEVWVRVQLPDKKFRDPAILFMTYDQVFQVYLDGKPIYNFGSFDTASKKRSPGSPWHLIELPENYCGKYMFIRMYSVRSANEGMIKRFDLGSKSTHIVNIVRDGLVTAILASMFIFVGICSFLLFIIKSRDQRLFLFLSMSSISTGCWLLAGGTMKQFIFNAPDFWVYVEIVSQYSIPICFSFLLNHLLQNKYNTIFRSISYISGLVLAASLFVDFTHILPLVATLPAFYITFSIEMVICIAIIIKSFSKWSLEIKIMCFGLISLCVVGIFDILNWNFNVNHRETFFTQWGMFIFLFSMAFILIFHFIRTQEKVDIYSLEIQSQELIISERKRELEAIMASDKIKTEFFSNISHELRTPLNILLSSIQLLFLYKEDGSLTNGQIDIGRYLKIMKQNCYRLVRLVNNLIDITKIDSGYLKLSLENHNIVSIVEDITLSVAEYMKSKGINLIFDTDVEEKIMACDPDKIERIILNLLSNAVKFSNPGSEIDVTMSDKGSQIIISIKDNGIGMEEDKLKMIFERFAQIDRSLTRNHEGSGIGLSLVKSLVEMHKGTISVESVYGEGSTFTISLPAYTVKPNNRNMDDSEIHTLHVEKVDIEFSDIYS